jgi:hypothetical protein
MREGDKGVEPRRLHVFVQREKQPSSVTQFMDTKPAKSKYLVLSRGASWETILSSTELRKMSEEFVA